jgi:uncharacterized protein (DUF362 family)
VTPKKLIRRDFLKLSAAGAAAIGTGVSFPGDVSAQDFSPFKAPGRVTQVRHSGAMSNPERVNSDPVDDVVAMMVDAGLLAFTGKGDIADAWREFIDPSDQVMIKINCLGSPNMATNTAVVQAIIRGLQAMGLRNDQMLVYDQYRSRMLRAGFRAGREVLGVPIEYNESQGYRDERTEHGSGRSAFSVAFEASTAVINVPVIKDHDACGVTISMKNITHGVIDNPSRMHRQNCNPSIANIYNTEMVRDRVRVIVCDGLRCMFDGGPQDNANKALHNSIYVATDPVALDTIGHDVVNAVRDEQGLRSIEDDGRPCDWLAIAEGYGLGIHDREQITLEEHVLG